MYNVLNVFAKTLGLIFFDRIDKLVSNPYQYVISLASAAGDY